MVKLRATIEQDGGATGIEIPAEIVTSMGSSKRPKVRVTINGYTYRSSVASMGGRFMLGVSAKVREEAGVVGGDTVDVDIELDTEPREVVVPPDLAAAFRRDPEAKRVFDDLSFSKKQRFVLPIEDAKTAETRQRRIDKTIAAPPGGCSFLRAGQHFEARALMCTQAVASLAKLAALENKADQEVLFDASLFVHRFVGSLCRRDRNRHGRAPEQRLHRRLR
jgi:hypothetical protein